MAEQTAGGIGSDDGSTPAARAPAGPADAAEAAEQADPAATIAELRSRIADLEDKWRRALADLDNLRRRVARQAEQVRGEERARVSAEWLPVLDNLELALQHADADPAALVPGIRAVRDQAVATLARLGFGRHTEVGTMFDPARHEAVATVRDRQAPPGTVVEVVRPGYGEDEHQLRPAAVVVATRDE